jgi:hypothetical protein
LVELVEEINPCTEVRTFDADLHWFMNNWSHKVKCFAMEYEHSLGHSGEEATMNSGSRGGTRKKIGG